jgi:hypothetical protein
MQELGLQQEENEFVVRFFSHCSTPTVMIPSPQVDLACT